MKILKVVSTMFLFGICGLFFPAAIALFMEPDESTNLLAILSLFAIPFSILLGFFVGLRRIKE